MASQPSRLITKAVTVKDVARTLPLAGVDELERYRWATVEQRVAVTCDDRKGREMQLVHQAMR